MSIDRRRFPGRPCCPGTVVSATAMHVAELDPKPFPADVAYRRLPAPDGQPPALRAPATPAWEDDTVLSLASYVRRHQTGLIEAAILVVMLALLAATVSPQAAY